MNTDHIKLSFEPQDPADSLIYELSFEDTLASVAPVTISSLSWSMAPIDGDLSPMAIVAHSEDSPITYTRVQLAGGTLGNTYTARCSLQFSDGEHLTVSFTVECLNT